MRRSNRERENSSALTLVGQTALLFLEKTFCRNPEETFYAKAPFQHGLCEFLVERGMLERQAENSSSEDEGAAVARAERGYRLTEPGIAWMRRSSSRGDFPSLSALLP